jgi:poly(A) polymerase
MPWPPPYSAGRPDDGAKPGSTAAPSAYRGPVTGTDPLFVEVAPLATRFAEAGHRVYLVGGIVRDRLLGLELTAGSDIDLTTDATPAETKELVAPLADAVWTQGERFGTIGASIGSRVYEITTHRAERYDPDSRHPAVDFSTRVVDDLSRRDFTVNAMAISLPDGELVDPFGGRHDLAARVLRTPLAPELSFTDDPLRMLRAARFVARYGLVPVPELEAAAVRFAGRLTIVSAERVRDELDKLVLVADPTVGLELLARTGVLALVLPELARDHESVVAAGRRVAAVAPRLVVRLAALLADLGADTVAERLGALRASSDQRRRVTGLVALGHRVGETAADPSPGALRLLVHEAGPLLDDLLELVAAEDPGAATATRTALADLGRGEDLGALGPELDGATVMARLGLRPGPEVGEALAFLLRLRIDHGPVGADEAGRRLDAWWSARAGTDPD